jgi:hypothetical protein
LPWAWAGDGIAGATIRATMIAVYGLMKRLNRRCFPIVMAPKAIANWLLLSIKPLISVLSLG